MKRAAKRLTEAESPIMKALWADGPLFVREILERYDEPRPHFNTVATQVRILEEKGYVAHEVLGNSHRFYAVVGREYFRDRSLAGVIRDYFDNSYKNVVSALVQDEKISVEELRDIIKLVEEKKKNNN